MNKFGNRLKMGQSQSSFHKSSQSEQLDPQTIPTSDELLKRQESFQESMNLNIKDHLDKIESMLLHLREDLKTSHRDMHHIKDELARVNHEKLKQDDAITSFVCDEVNRLTGDLRKGGNEDLTKVNNFTIQIVQLKLEKEDLEQKTFQTELRTNMCENSVGFKRVYD